MWNLWQKKSNIFKYELYFCLNCQKNICPLCKNKHNNSHSTINYDKINFLFKVHNDFFSKFCNDCGENICMSCKEEHEDQDNIYFRSTIPKKNILKNSSEELKKELFHPLTSRKNNFFTFYFDNRKFQ